MNSVEKVSERKWKKIYSDAEEYLWAYNAKSKAALCAKSQNKPSGRAYCYEPDTELYVLSIATSSIDCRCTASL